MCMVRLFFFFNDTATTEIYTLSLHDALPIYQLGGDGGVVVALGEDVGDAERADPADQGVLRLAAPVGEVPGVEDAVHVELVDHLGDEVEAGGVEVDVGGVPQGDAAVGPGRRGQGGQRRVQRADVGHEGLEGGAGGVPP